MMALLFIVVELQHQPKEEEAYWKEVSSSIELDAHYYPKNSFKGSRSYVRPQQFVSINKVGIDGVSKKTTSEEIKKLRFSHHRTAFDVDIDALETQPWRHKDADISDYFNYGFNEKTWQVH
jgi:hypothetical protein